MNHFIQHDYYVPGDVLQDGMGGIFVVRTVAKESLEMLSMQDRQLHTTAVTQCGPALTLGERDALLRRLIKGPPKLRSHQLAKDTLDKPYALPGSPQRFDDLRQKFQKVPKHWYRFCDEKIARWAQLRTRILSEELLKNKVLGQLGSPLGQWVLEANRWERCPVTGNAVVDDPLIDAALLLQVCEARCPGAVGLLRYALNDPARLGQIHALFLAQEF